MEFTTLLTHRPGAPWRAVVPGLPDCIAEAPTRAEVLVKIQARIAETVSSMEVLQVEVTVAPKGANGTASNEFDATPWSFFGAFQGDAQWSQVFDEIEEQRNGRTGT